MRCRLPRRFRRRLGFQNKRRKKQREFRGGPGRGKGQQKRLRQGLEGVGPVEEPAALSGVEAPAPVVRALTHLLQRSQDEPHDNGQDALLQ
jgi:hypothetical protein